MEKRGESKQLKGLIGYRCGFVALLGGEGGKKEKDLEEKETKL